MKFFIYLPVFVEIQVKMTTLEADTVLYSILALVIIENALEIYIALRQVRTNYQAAGTCLHLKRLLNWHMYICIFMCAVHTDTYVHTYVHKFSRILNVR